MTRSLAAVRLRPRRDHTMRAGHPWIFSGAIHDTEGSPADGAEVLILAHDGTPLGRGLWNSGSQIRVRAYSTQPDEPLDAAFWQNRIARALAARSAIPGLPEGAPARLVFSEGDGLSGLVVDRIGDWLVVQLTSLALHARLDLLLDALEAALSPRGILLRTEKGILKEEGLVLSDGLLRGEMPEGPVVVEDDGLRFLADLRTGQKTGFYLDQRWNRRAVAPWTRGRRVADVCTYSGGFALHAARAGAHSVVGVDVSAPALTLAEENAGLNGLAHGTRWVRGDAVRWMEAARDAGERFEAIILDPPRYARSRSGVQGALRGYARLNAAALRLLEPGGILATFSCSGRVSAEAFLGVLGEVAGTTGRRLRVVEALGQPADHPVDPATPETAYLKGFIVQVE